MKSALCFVRGAISATLLLLNCLLFPIPVILLCALSRLVPLASWRHRLERLAQRSPYLWTSINNAIISISNRHKIEVILPADLRENRSYLILSNHQSWIDILLIYGLLNHKTTPIKFFMKKELLWTLPFAGLTCKLIGYPFMERHSKEDIRRNPALKGKDLQTTRQACKSLTRIPGSLMNFVEGTRFTIAKQKKQNSPFKHLLKPRAGGISVALEELHTHLSGILDITIYYDTLDKGFWAFASGQFNKIYVKIRRLDIPPELIGNYYEDRSFRPQFQSWLNTIWYEKDATLDELEAACQKNRSS